MNLQNSNFLKKLFVEYAVPMNRSLGIKLKRIDDAETVLGMKKRRKNLNYGGTVHGAAILALAETVHGVAVLNKFAPAEHLMVSKNSDLQFLKKARGDLQVLFRLGDDMEAHIENQLREHGVCEVELKSTVTDQSEDAVANLTAIYHIKRRNRK